TSPGVMIIGSTAAARRAVRRAGATAASATAEISCSKMTTFTSLWPARKRPRARPPYRTSPDRFAPAARANSSFKRSSAAVTAGGAAANGSGMIDPPQDGEVTADYLTAGGAVKKPGVRLVVQLGGADILVCRSHRQTRMSAPPNWIAPHFHCISSS